MTPTKANCFLQYINGENKEENIKETLEINVSATTIGNDIFYCWSVIMLHAAPSSEVIQPTSVPQPAMKPPPVPTVPSPKSTGIQPWSPLSTIDTNALLEFSRLTLGPTDEQKQNVEAIVVMGTLMVPTAMKCVYVLFSKEELASGNTSRTSGHRQLGDLKLRFLQKVLTAKESMTWKHFGEQWENIKANINSQWRGKKRTAHRLFFVCKKP